LGLPTATAGTGSGFLFGNLFFPHEFWAINQLVCELVSSQLLALGLLIATVGISNALFL
jgi:hypothetical protein